MRAIEKRGRADEVAVQRAREELLEQAASEQLLQTLDEVSHSTCGCSRGSLVYAALGTLPPAPPLPDDEDAKPDDLQEKSSKVRAADESALDCFMRLYEYTYMVR